MSTTHATSSVQSPPARTDAEWELLNLESASNALHAAWSSVLRAGYRNTRQVPNQYQAVILMVRMAMNEVDAMRKEREG